MAEETGPLSDRELELLRLLATGATNREIARELVISVNTVKVHLRNIYGKLGVASRTEATMVAVREGWIAVPGAGDEAEGAADEAPAGLPLPERWPRVSIGKRLGLVFATLLAVAALVLPEVLQSASNGGQADPIGIVFPTAPSGSQGSRWRTRAQMPTPRTDLAVVEYDGLIYAIGGVSSAGVTGKVEVYDPQADAWSSRNAKPTPVGFVSAVVLSDKIYVPGGFDAGPRARDILEIYDPTGDAWETGAPMPEALGGYGLAALDGQLYLFGGRDGGGYVDAVYRYDPQADAWQAMQPMAQARGYLGAAALSSEIYVVGGYDGVTEQNSCAAYDPAGDAWRACAAMDLPRGGLTVVAVREQLYAIGGGMDGYLAFNERYDPRVDRWIRLETPVQGQWLGAGGAFLYPFLYTIGGWNGDYLSVNESYQALYQLILP
jgi:DNA-binding CsgD family transcriptional regulator